MAEQRSNYATPFPVRLSRELRREAEGDGAPRRDASERNLATRPR